MAQVINTNVMSLNAQRNLSTNSSSDRAALQAEVSQLSQEIDRVATQTDFNGTKLLDGSTASFTIQVGADAGSDNQIDISTVNMTATATAVAALDISSASGATAALTAIDTQLQTVNTARADLGAIQNRFSSVISNLQNSSENLSAARSRIQDTDYAKETAELTRTQILQQAGTAMLAQAKSVPQNVLSLLQ